MNQSPETAGRHHSTASLPWKSRHDNVGRDASLHARIAATIARVPRLLLRAPILVYRYTLSSFMGRQCRFLPTCSAYADEAIGTHGAWAGGWMAASRICRCHPWGDSGFDPVPQCLPADAHWLKPWRYGRWRKPRDGERP